MKKTLVGVLLVLIVLSTGCSRKQNDEMMSGLGDPIQEYDYNQSFQVGDEKNAFTVPEKKAKNGDRNIVILRITNNSNIDYDLTIARFRKRNV